MAHVSCGCSEKRCPKTGKPIVSPPPARRSLWLRLLYPVLGLAALAWFLVRVIPKPSRASYPCQRAAIPVAAGFVAWLAGVLGSTLAFNRARFMARRSRWIVASLSLAVGCVSLYMAITHAPQEAAQAYTYEDRYAVKTPNDPLGTARGMHPGRVVWVHDPDATDWADPTPEDYYDDFWWDDGNTDQAVVDAMVSDGIRWLAGASTDAAAWDSLFRDFNLKRGEGDNGYHYGEKIAIKINLTVVNVSGYNAVDNDGNQVSNLPWNSVSMEMILSMLDQLVNQAGVPQQDIYIGDPTCYFPNREYEYLSAVFPDVNYMSGRDGKTLPGRQKTSSSNVPFYFSDPASAGTTQDYLPTYYAEAKYFINFAILKAHLGAVTLCGKNHYGSLNRRPADSGYYNMHNSLPYINGNSGQYRALVDLMGHKDTGGKTLLYILDGLWGGYSWGGVCPPQKWRMAPFNGDHPNSMFFSQDPVAIDSVGFDFWWAEDQVSWDYFPFDSSNGGRQHMPHLAGGEDYLIEAALADNPPSGTFYDPENDGVRMSSQGVVEHWNNATDKQYSRNLGIGDGIELVTGPPATVAASVAGRHVFYNTDDPIGQGPDIAGDKSALLPGATHSFANCTSFSKGITGVIVDVNDLAGAVEVSDFECHVYDGLFWHYSVAPTVTVAAGAGVGGSDRILLTWADGDVRNCWLSVTMLATGRTGLTEDDQFLFGNLAADATGDFAVDIQDFVVLKQNYGGTPGFDTGDFNHDDVIDIQDFVTLKQNYGLALDAPGELP